MNFINIFMNKVKLQKNFKTLKNSFELIGFYYNDAFKGLLNKPFLKKRFNRWMMGISFFTLYFWHFLINMKEIGNLLAGERTLDYETNVELTRITIISYFNMCVILSIIIFLTVNTMISFTKSSIYITNILPYSKKELLIGQKIFKLSIGLIIYEAVLIIVFPFLSQLSVITLINKFTLLLILHFIFIVIFSLMDILYGLLAQVTMYNNIISLSNLFIVLDIFFSIVSSIYFAYKINIDIYIGQSDISITNIILVVFLFLLVMLFSIIVITYKFDLSIPNYKKQFYGLIKLPMVKLNLMTTFPSIYRHQNFVHITVLVSVFFIVLVYQIGFKESVKNIPILNIFLLFSAINYADATAKIRRYYNFFRVSLFDEVLSIFISGMILSMSSLFVILYFHESIVSIFLLVTIYLSAIISGILFPTTQGNLNETTAVTTTIFLSIILYFIIKNSNLYFLIIVSLVLLLILTLFLKRERDI